MNDCIRDAYSALRTVTPLPHGLDCGKLCGAYCCRGSDSDGMELFHGEERRFENDPRFMIVTDGTHNILICRGVCDRKTRPLACRMYPLYPVPEKTETGWKIRVVYDVRGLRTCPIVSRGIKPDPRFVAAVRKAGQILLRDAHNETILRETAEILEDLTAFTERLKEDTP